MIKQKTHSSYIISHADSIIYKDFKLNPAFFEIHKEFIPAIPTNQKNGKRKRQLLSETAESVQKIYLQEILPLSTESCEDNEVAVKTAKDFYALSNHKDNSEDSEIMKFNGANDTEEVVISEVGNISYVFPPRCGFFNCDLFEEEFKFKIEDNFDLVVIDPPWQNKFIKRRKGNVSGYKLHETDEIGEKLMKFFPSILKPFGILAIWSTNSKVDKILKEFLPKWGLSHVTTLHWLKVTKSFLLTTPFTKENGKQPYESLIIASNGPPPEISSKKLIVSTPSAINSHKPPLTPLLEDLFSRKFDKKCELFARYLQSDYTSYGNQVCKLNNASLFIK